MTDEELQGKLDEFKEKYVKMSLEDIEREFQETLKGCFAAIDALDIPDDQKSVIESYVLGIMAAAVFGTCESILAEIERHETMAAEIKRLINE